MNRGLPFADAVAVRDGRVLAVGSRDDVERWGPCTIDDRFADKVLLPGFIEAHSHVMSGGLWNLPYVGFFDRTDPDGTVWEGCRSIDEVVDRLLRVEADVAAGEPLIAWGLDPIYFTGERLLAQHLDRVSERRPIFVFHASAHLATVNTAMLDVSEISSSTTTPGVARNEDGTPNGELQEPPAMSLARIGMIGLGTAIASDDAYWNYARTGRNAGHTLITDLGTSRVNSDTVLETWRRTTAAPDYPCRVMVAGSPMFGGPQDPDELAEIVTGLRDSSTDKLRFGVVKLILDGSIQGFTARVNWPHYLNPPDGHPGNGQWLMAPDQVAETVKILHRARITVHCHCNGDQASEVFIDAVERAIAEDPWLDHRHTVQHCQMTTASQYERMGRAGMSANIFSNHLFHWGDQHRDITLGPERAARIDGCNTARRSGVRFSFHSDAPVTPMGHLHVAWCAVNRLTATGEVLGPDECISVEQALRAATIDAAHQLRLDHEMGSIEVGKLADFAVLDDDPLDVDPVTLKDIGVWGTVLGGVPHPART